MSFKMAVTFQQNLMTATSFIVPTSIVLGFHALSDPLRIQVLELLRERELCVCELCEHLGTTQSKLSFHLKALKEANLVRARQEKRWIYYSLNLPQFVVLEQYLSEYRRFSPILPARQCSDTD
jgi:ArsR family transcriptional regulator